MNEDEHWEREALREIALEGIRERRRARRWGIFFKIVGFAYLFLLLALVGNFGMQFAGESAARPHAAVVKIEGTIAAEQRASAERIIEGLEDAFTASGVRGVILEINSPGGSPVQSGRVYDAIDRLQAQHPDVPVYVVAGDYLASGAYYIAAAADEIHANKASVVGSIGVLMSSFGFTEAIERLGVERRLFTAGRNKAFMDPFSELTNGQIDHLRTILDRIHQQFIEAVRAGRGDRLNGDPDELFSGLYWTGERALELGLIDGLSSRRELLSRMGVEETVNYTPEDDWINRVTRQMGASVAAGLWESAVTAPIAR